MGRGTADLLQVREEVPSGRFLPQSGREGGASRRWSSSSSCDGLSGGGIRSYRNTSQIGEPALSCQTRNYFIFHN